VKQFVSLPEPERNRNFFHCQNEIFLFSNITRKPKVQINMDSTFKLFRLRRHLPNILISATQFCTFPATQLYYYFHGAGGKKFQIKPSDFIGSENREESGKFFDSTQFFLVTRLSRTLNFMIKFIVATLNYINMVGVGNPLERDFF